MRKLIWTYIVSKLHEGSFYALRIIFHIYPTTLSTAFRKSFVVVVFLLLLFCFFVFFLFFFVVVVVFLFCFVLFFFLFCFVLFFLPGILHKRSKFANFCHNLKQPFIVTIYENVTNHAEIGRLSKLEADCKQVSFCSFFFLISQYCFEASN